MAMKVDQRDLADRERRTERVQGDLLAEVARTLTELRTPDGSQASIGVLEDDRKAMPTHSLGEARRCRRANESVGRSCSHDAHVRRLETTSVRKREREELLGQRQAHIAESIDDITWPDDAIGRDPRRRDQVVLDGEVVRARASYRADTQQARGRGRCATLNEFSPR